MYLCAHKKPGILFFSQEYEVGVQDLTQPMWIEDGTKFEVTVVSCSPKQLKPVCPKGKDKTRCAGRSNQENTQLQREKSRDFWECWPLAKPGRFVDDLCILPINPLLGLKGFHSSPQKFSDKDTHQNPALPGCRVTVCFILLTRTLGVLFIIRLTQQQNQEVCGQEEKWDTNCLYFPGTVSRLNLGYLIWLSQLSYQAYPVLEQEWQPERVGAQAASGRARRGSQMEVTTGSALHTRLSSSVTICPRAQGCLRALISGEKHIQSH